MVVWLFGCTSCVDDAIARGVHSDPAEHGATRLPDGVLVIGCMI